MSSPVVEPYLLFGGRCEEALEFYRVAVGAQVDFLMRFKDSPQPMPPGGGDRIMHASFRIGQSRLMASDGDKEGTKFAGFSLSIAVQSEAEADRLFTALAQGGQVRMPLAKTFWSAKFGTLTDRFGINWMVTVESPNE